MPVLLQRMAENFGQIQYFDMQGHCFSALADAFPEQAEYQALAATAYFAAHDTAQAWYYFQTCLAMGYQSIPLMLHAAKASYEEAAYGQAVTLLHKVIQIGGEQAAVFNLLGNAYFMFGQYESALEHYHKACNLVPQSPVFVANWASTVEVMQGVEPALQQLKAHPHEHGWVQQEVLAELVLCLQQNQSGLAGQVRGLA